MSFDHPLVGALARGVASGHVVTSDSRPAIAMASETAAALPEISGAAAWDLPIVTNPPAVLVQGEPRARKATIGRRPKTDAALADQSCTPKWLADRLPPRDFDPCSGPRSHVRATIEISLETGGDGLAEPWYGAGFQNNPFSAPLAWMQKAAYEINAGHCRDLIVLCKHDPGTAWWHALVRASAGDHAQRFARVECWMFHKRIQYDEHPDLIERRRLERVAKAMKNGETNPEKLARITGKSSANFCSAIVHHRGIGYPMLALDDVADRWVTP